ncbi:MAG TPA: peptidoglycan-binding protein, partial [Rhodospirillales bacterium]|nr:peptidoglycan-binding protein [Rhodospirillales bacterium]
AAPVGQPDLPETRNRADDVGRVEGALGRAGVLGGARRCPVFDTRLETGVRDFQRQKGLKVDGLLNPGGPTIHTLGRALCLAAAEGALGRGGFGQRPPGPPPDDDDCRRHCARPDGQGFQPQRLWARQDRRLLGPVVPPRPGPLRHRRLSRRMAP